MAVTSIIDKLQIQSSGKCFQAQLPVNQAGFIDQFNLTVRKAGWTLSDVTFATDNFNFFLGAPGYGSQLPIPNKTIARCSPNPFLKIGAATFTLYNPQTQFPDPAAMCVMVPMGPDTATTLGNLVAHISGATNFNATLNFITGPLSFYQIVITGKFAGPDLNFVPVAVDGAYGVAGSSVTLGGGWTLTSAGSFQAQTSAFSVTLTGIANAATDGGPAVQFAFNLDGLGTPTYLLDMIAVIPPPINSYTLICNPYSFAVFDQSDDQSFPFASRQTSLAAFAPYQPVEEGFQACYAVFIVGPHNLRTGTVWGLGPNNWKGPITTCLDSLPATYNNFPACPRCLAFRQPGTQPLLTPDGQPLITTAWIMMGGDPWHGVNTNPAIVGRLWDCALVSDVTTGLSIAGQNYVKLGSQDGSNGLTRSTLVMCNGTAPPPPTPPPPTAPPSGTSLGIVQVQGNELIWVRGQVFDASMNGKPIFITINGVDVGPFTGQMFDPHHFTLLVVVGQNGEFPWHT